MKYFKRRKKSILIFIGFNLFFISTLLFLSPGTKVEIRNALFTSEATNDYFELSPTQLQEKYSNFLWFDASIKDYYKSRIKQKDYIDSLTKLGIDDMSLIKKLNLYFSKNGSSDPSDCGKYSDDLIKNMIWLHSENGKGCCSDHSQVLIAYSLLANLICREVHNIPHTFNEYYDRQLNKWVWIDPQYCLLAKGPNNNYLSLFEIKKLYSENKKPYLIYFGLDQSMAAYISNNLINEYYNKTSFDAIRMTMGNNVFAVDSLNKKYDFLPRNIRQLYLLTTGKQPGWIFNEIGTKLKFHYNIIKFSFYSFVLFCLILNICFFYYWKRTAN